VHWQLFILVYSVLTGARHPPEGALVISFDEKPMIQALERAQGYLKFPDGRTLSGRSHDYKRHGTTHLFAALNVATGKVKTGHYNRKGRLEFLDFMNQIAAAFEANSGSLLTHQLLLARR